MKIYYAHPISDYDTIYEANVERWLNKSRLPSYAGKLYKTMPDGGRK